VAFSTNFGSGAGMALTKRVGPAGMRGGGLPIRSFSVAAAWWHPAGAPRTAPEPSQPALLLPESSSRPFSSSLAFLADTMAPPKGFGPQRGPTGMR
jgi:hypothetical protein